MTSETAKAGQVSQTAAIQDTDNTTTSSHNGSGGNPRPVRYATEADWAMHRMEIQRLYMEEELPLKEVMHIMKEKNNLRAT